jgi:hypothetical protein
MTRTTLDMSKKAHRVAVHEAGHAIVADHFGHVMIECALDAAHSQREGHMASRASAKRPVRAYVKVRGSDNYRARKPWETPNVRRELMISAAGHAAVDIYCFNTGQPKVVDTGASDDFDQSVEWLISLGMGRKQAERKVQMIARPTLHFALRLHLETTALALQLLRHKKLAGPKLSQLLPRASVTPAPT